MELDEIVEISDTSIPPQVHRNAVSVIGELQQHHFQNTSPLKTSLTETASLSLENPILPLGNFDTRVQRNPLIRRLSKSSPPISVSNSVESGVNDLVSTRQRKSNTEYRYEPDKSTQKEYESMMAQYRESSPIDKTGAGDQIARIAAEQNPQGLALKRRGSAVRKPSVTTPPADTVTEAAIKCEMGDFETRNPVFETDNYNADVDVDLIYDSNEFGEGSRLVGLNVMNAEVNAPVRQSADRSNQKSSKGKRSLGVNALSTQHMKHRSSVLNHLQESSPASVVGEGESTTGSDSSLVAKDACDQTVRDGSDDEQPSAHIPFVDVECKGRITREENEAAFTYMDMFKEKSGVDTPDFCNSLNLGSMLQEEYCEMQVGLEMRNEELMTRMYSMNMKMDDEISRLEDEGAEMQLKLDAMSQQLRESGEEIEGLKAAVAEKCRALQELEAAEATANATISSQNERISDFEALETASKNHILLQSVKIQELAEAAGVSAHRLNECLETIASLEVVQAQLRTQRQGDCANIEELSAANVALQTDVKQQAAQISDLRTTQEQLEGSIQRLEEDSCTLTAALELQNAKLKSVEASGASLGDQVDFQSQRIKALESSESMLHSHIETQRLQISTLEGTAAALQLSVAARDERIDKLEAAKADMRVQLGANTETIRAFEESEALLRGVEEAQAKEMLDLQQQWALQAATIAQLETLHAEATAQIQRVESEKAVLQGVNTALSHQVAGLEVYKETIQAGLGSLSQKVGEADIKVATMEVAKLQLQQALVTAEQRCMQAEASVATLTSDIVKLTSRLDESSLSLSSEKSKTESQAVQILQLEIQQADLLASIKVMAQAAHESATQIGVLEHRGRQQGESLEEQAVTLQAKVAQFSDLEIQFAAKVEAISRQGIEIERLSAIVAELESDCSDFSDQASQARSEVASLKEVRAALSEEIRRLEDKQLNLRASLEDMNRQSSEGESELWELQESKAILEAEVVRLKVAERIMSERVDSSNIYITALETKLAFAEEGVRAKQEEIALWQSQALQVGSIIDRLEYSVSVVPRGGGGGAGSTDESSGNSSLQALNALTEAMEQQQQQLSNGQQQAELDWVPDAEHKECMEEFCGKAFTLIRRRHHCRVCGGIFCGDCVPVVDLPNKKGTKRACKTCVLKLAAIPTSQPTSPSPASQVSSAATSASSSPLRTPPKALNNG